MIGQKPMKKKLLLFTLVILCTLLFAVACADNPPSADSTQGGTDTSNNGNVEDPAVENPNPTYVINSFYDLNKKNNSELSHEKETGYAEIELDYRSYVRLGVKELGTNTVYYPRIKQMADGRYIMFYNEGEHGDTVFFITSDDLKTWSKPEALFSYEKEKDVKYATCDAVVLDNGDILAVCSYRTASTYDINPHLNGIVMKKSSDNAKSWSAQKVIYVGTTWEPYPMQLASGEVQVYFTNTTCYYRTATQDASTGTALVRSFDRGESWTGNLSAPYSGQIVSQTATRVSGGVQLYTDQMPVGIEMLGSGKLMLALESRMDKKGTFRISLSYSADNWKTPLEANKEGPSEKIEQAWIGAAPYLRQFVSGEIVCAYTRQNYLAYRISPANGKSFTNVDTMPFEKLSHSYWGGLEVVDTHTMVGFGETFNKVTVNRTDNTVDYGKLNLNHSITSKKMTPAIDGDAKDWADNDEALFIGSESQAQASIRSAADGEYLYFLVERLDEYLTSGDADTVTLFFNTPKSKGFYRLTVGPEGIVKFSENSGDGYVDANVNAECSVIVNGTLDYDDDLDMGYSAEIKISFADIGGASDEASVYLNLANKDAGKKSLRDELANCNITNKKSWLKIYYK